MSRSEYSFVCFAYCQEFLLFKSLLFRFIQLFFPKPLSRLGSPRNMNRPLTMRFSTTRLLFLFQVGGWLGTAFSTVYLFFFNTWFAYLLYFYCYSHFSSQQRVGSQVNKLTQGNLFKNPKGGTGIQRQQNHDLCFTKL